MNVIGQEGGAEAFLKVKEEALDSALEAKRETPESVIEAEKEALLSVHNTLRPRKSCS